MSIGDVWRWIDEPVPRSHPAAQMALDSVVAEWVAAGKSPPTIRLYRWAPGIVSVGRLQDIGVVYRTYPSDLLVRRETGGAAVVHGDDLTISVVAPIDVIAAAARGHGVLAAHDAIVGGVEQALHRVGVDTVRGDAKAARQRSVDCFSFAARCDLRCARTGEKLLGSAQLRKNGIVLQQMSLRLQAETAGSDRFTESLQAEMATALGVTSWNFCPLDAGEELAAAIAAESWEVRGFKEEASVWPEKS